MQRLVAIVYSTAEGLSCDNHFDFLKSLTRYLKSESEKQKSFLCFFFFLVLSGACLAPTPLINRFAAFCMEGKQLD